GWIMVQRRRMDAGAGISAGRVVFSKGQGGNGMSRFVGLGRLGAVIAALSGVPASAAVVYVNSAAAGSAYGSSWANAYTDLGLAISAAGAGDEIWVARGTYRPAGAGGSRDATFALKTGVSLYGGFSGSETTREERDWVANPTVLSGD